MITVEIPLRTINDEISAVANLAETPAGCTFAAGVMAALQWIADREARDPVMILLQDYESKGGVH